MEKAGYRKTIVKKKNLLSPFSDAFHRFDAVFPFTEGSKTQVTFAARTETDARRTYYMHIVQQTVEELPGSAAFWSLQPQVRRVYTTEYLETGLDETFAHDAGILQVVVDGFLDLFLSFRTVDGFGRTLGDVTCTVELGTLAAVPQFVQGNTFAVGSPGHDFFRHYGIAATYTGESGSLREAAEL